MNARKKHWERIYTERSPLEVSWYQKEPALSLKLIRNTGISGEAPILDVGGGASLLTDRLLEEGYSSVALLDISSGALKHAATRLGARAEQVEWFEADVTEFAPPHPFALWHDRAVFHFLTDAGERRKYVEVLKKSLMDGGHVIMAAFALDGPRRCSGLDIVRYDAAKMSRELGETFRLVEETEELHETPAGAVQKFVYFRFVKGNSD